MFILFFLLLLLLSVLPGFVFKIVLRSVFNIISAAGLRKKYKQGGLRANFHTSGRRTELRLVWETNLDPVT